MTLKTLQRGRRKYIRGSSNEERGKTALESPGRPGFQSNVAVIIASQRSKADLPSYLKVVTQVGRKDQEENLPNSLRA